MQDTPPAGLEIRDLIVRYGERRAVDGVSLSVAPGAFVTLLGPSGCGKTTLLRAVAGFEPVASGTIALDGQPLDGLPPEKRPTAMVFQTYALFPHLSVARNVAFGLESQRRPKAEIDTRVREALSLVQLGDRADASVTALSGGQQQRVALARAVVTRPRLLLFDEPLSNLDAALREETRLELRRLHERTGITSLYVTHDQAEALALADTLAVLRNGRVEQVGTPHEVYRHPATVFVAGFLGRATVLPAEITGARSVRLGTDQTIEVTDLPDSADASVALAIPPEAVRLGGGSLAGTVTAVQFLGATTDLSLDIGLDRPLRALLLGVETPPKVGERVSFGLDPSRLTVLPRNGR